MRRMFMNWTCGVGRQWAIAAAILTPIAVAAPQAGGGERNVRSLTRSTRLVAGADTLDNYMGDESGPRTKDNTYYVQTVVRRGQRWEARRQWYDSSGRADALGVTRTRAGSVAPETESVRAARDSASLLIGDSAIVGWVVPEGEPQRLISAPTSTERYNLMMEQLAIAAERPEIGTTYVVARYDLYGPQPLALLSDTLRVTRRGVFHQGAATINARLAERSNGAGFWFDEATGRILALRGKAGPRWWWNRVRGVTGPD